jgi:hypothetical protein
MLDYGNVWGKLCLGDRVNRLINSGFEDEQNEEVKEVEGDVTSADRFTITWGNIKR